MTLQDKEVVFDEQGNTLTEEVTGATAAIAHDDLDGGTDPTDDSNPGQQQDTPPAGKYRIGDKTFATQDEALEYARSQVSTLETEQQIADAYRQGMREALAQVPTQSDSVTPRPIPADDLDTEELYTNPKSFLDKYAHKIKSETRAEFEHRESVKTESDRIWREFTERHPGLAEFRGEVEEFVGKNVTEVRAIIGTKGRPASYDWIATKLKSRFEQQYNAIKPKRELPNGGAGTSPSTRASGVTPKTEPKKLLSFSDQLRSIRSNKRR